MKVEHSMIRRYQIAGEDDAVELPLIDFASNP